MGWPHLTKQNRVFHTMCCHAGFRWGGAGRRELTHGSGACSAGPVWQSGSLGCVVCVVHSPYRYHCCSCSLCCCSVKLPLSQPTSFCLFLSILLCTPEGRGVATWCFCCQPQPNHNTSENIYLHTLLLLLFPYSRLMSCHFLISIALINHLYILFMNTAPKSPLHLWFLSFLLQNLPSSWVTNHTFHSFSPDNSILVCC